MPRWFYSSRRQKKTPSPPAAEERHPRATAPLAPALRTYLPDAPYLLPKDAQEDARLTYQHHLFYRAISNHYLAPLTTATTTTILDVGTGTGIWPVDMAVLFPRAHIIGVDITLASLPKPLPENCLFSQADILHGLNFPDEQFSFTHQRLMVAAIPAAKWSEVIRELVRVTRRGGWIEMLEIGDSIVNAGPATTRLLGWMVGISKGMGFEVGILHQLGDLLEQAGCHQVERQDILVPLGDWSGHEGHMMKTDVLHGYQALKEKYCQAGGIEPQQFDAMVYAAAAEWETNQASYTCHAFYGRRR